jgi:predicted ATPase
VNLPVVGSESIERDATMAQVRQLGDQLKYVWNKRTRRGFFMRSEDFFGFVRRMAQVEADMHADLREIDNDPTISDKSLARLPYMQELGALKRAYGDGLDAQSHGESYFKLFRSRFVPDGLYLLDEPEAPLSPMRQLSLLAMLREMVKQKAQFIIATHSPILLAYPGAVIYSFDEDEVRQVAYDELEHVIVTRDFLNNPEAYLRHLMEL